MGEDKDSVWNIPFLRTVLNSKLHHQMSSWTFTHFLVERNLLRGPAAAISMTSIRLSPWHRPSMRTMKGLLSWCMISASLIISSFTSFSFSLFSTLTATSTWPLWPDKKKKGAGANQCQVAKLQTSFSLFLTFKSYDFVIKTPFLTEPKLPEPSSTSSISSWSLLMLNFLMSFGSW